MNGEGEKKRIRRMNRRYMMLAACIYIGIFILLLCINAILKVLLDFNPYIQLLLYLLYFFADAVLTNSVLHLPALRKVIYDPGN